MQTVMDLSAGTGCETTFGATLETLTPQVDRFLFANPENKLKSVNHLIGHLHPVARYFGSAALLELAVRFPRVAGDDAFEQAVLIADEAQSELTGRNTGLSYAFRAQKLIADAPVRHAVSLERRQPTPQELDTQRSLTQGILSEVAMASVWKHEQGSIDDNRRLEGFGAELATAVLLDDIGVTDYGVDYVTVGSLLSEDVLGRRKTKQDEGHGPTSRNWDLSVFTTDLQDPTYRLNIKHIKGHRKPCSTDITPIVVSELHDADVPGIVSFVDLATGFQRRDDSLQAAQTTFDAQDALLGRLHSNQ